MDDRRLVPRWQVGRRAGIRIEKSDNFDDCRVEDMNLKGARLMLTKRLPAESMLRMELALTKDCHVKAEVHVPWEKEEDGSYVYGLMFSSISDTDREQIYQFLTSNFIKQFKEKWWVKPQDLREGAELQ